MNIIEIGVLLIAFASSVIALLIGLFVLMYLLKNNQ
jgi:hypothetical protein